MKTSRVILLVLSLVVCVVSAGVIFWEYKPLMSDFFPHEDIKTSPPYNFAEADSIVHETVLLLVQKGLTEGEIDPYFHRHGDLRTRYESLVELSSKLHLLAQQYPDPARMDTTAAFRKRVGEVTSQAKLFSQRYLGLYSLYHKHKWFGLAFHLALLGIVYCIVLEGREEE